MEQENKLKSPFHIQMCSGKHNEHCDKFPHESIHEVYEDDKGIILTTKGNVDIVPQKFKWKKIEESFFSVKCDTCPNEFPENYNFINGSCIRCWERIHIGNSNGFGRDQYREYLREEFKREYKNNFPTDEEIDSLDFSKSTELPKLDLPAQLSTIEGFRAGAKWFKSLFK